MKVTAVSDHLGGAKESMRMRVSRIFDAVSEATRLRLGREKVIDLVFWFLSIHVL